MPVMSTTLIAVVLLVFALVVGGVGLLLVLGLVIWFMRRGKGEAEVEAEATDAPAPKAAAPAAPAIQPPAAEVEEEAEEDEGGATEVFSRDAHGRLMGWDDEDDEVDEEAEAGSTEVFDRDKMASYAELLEGGDLPELPGFVEED